MDKLWRVLEIEVGEMRQESERMHLGEVNIKRVRASRCTEE